MFCSNCGKEIPEGATKCSSCGMEIGNSNINFSDVANYAGDKINKAVSGVSEKTQAGFEAYKKEQNDRKVNSLSDIIIDSQEEQIAVIGSSYLNNALRGGGLTKGFGILTDKRFYFRGKCYTKIAGQHKAIDEEYIVDLENITATGFVFSRRFLLLIMAVLAPFVCYYIEFPYAIIPVIALLVLYYFTKMVMYEVYFEGGAVCVDVSKYGGMKEVKAFNKELRKAKDRVKK